MGEVQCVQDYAMYISLGLVAAEKEQMLKLSRLHWLEV